MLLPTQSSIPDLKEITISNTIKNYFQLSTLISIIGVVLIISNFKRNKTLLELFYYFQLPLQLSVFGIVVITSKFQHNQVLLELFQLLPTSNTIKYSWHCSVTSNFQHNKIFIGILIITSNFQHNQVLLELFCNSQFPTQSGIIAVAFLLPTQ